MRQCLRMFPEAGALFYGGAGCAGRNDTNGWLRTKSLTAVSELRSPQPRIRAARRTRRGCWRRNSTTTATLSSSERKRCSGAYDSRPIWICSAGWARNVANPVGVRAPAREDDRLLRLRVVRQRHRNRLAALPGLPTRVRHQQEGVAEEPAPSPLIQRERQTNMARSSCPGCRRTPSSGFALRPVLGVGVMPSSRVGRRSSTRRRASPRRRAARRARRSSVRGSRWRTSG